MQSYGGGYPYYGQPPYPQQPQQFVPPGHPHGYPASYYTSHPQYQQQPQPQSQYDYRDHPVIPSGMSNGVAPSKESHRKSHSTPGPAAHLPLKSSMKKTSYSMNKGNSSNGHGFSALTRQTTHPAYQGRPTQYMPQPTTKGGALIDPEFRPLHMFMLFVGNNELRLENIMQPAMDELRKSVLPIWPGGIESDSLSGYDWTVKFRNNPWSLQGPDQSIALDIVVHLFTLFARRGFSFQASMNTGSAPSRLIFEVTSADIVSHFFLAYFSESGRRFTLVKPPGVVDETLGHQLKAVLPRKVTEEVVEKRRTFVIKKRTGGFNNDEEIEAPFFLMHILKILSELGFSLVTAVPLGRRGPLGVKAGREMLVFKGAMDPVSPAPT